jgi:hypothetical protein
MKMLRDALLAFIQVAGPGMSGYSYLACTLTALALKQHYRNSISCRTIERNRMVGIWLTVCA